MTKFFKIIATSLHGIIEWLLILIIFLVFALRTSPVQTFLAHKATAFLSKELNTRVHLEQLDIVFVNKVDLKGFILMNQDQSDTIVNVNSLLVNVQGLRSFHNKVHVKSIALEGGIVKLEKLAPDGKMNLQFVIDYFKSDKKKKKSEPIPIAIDKVRLHDIRFHYNNQLSPPVVQGMDYQHLLLRDVELDARDVKMFDGTITADVRRLSAIEKSGFILDQFKSILKVSSNGIKLEEVNLKTPFSDINSKEFKLLYSSYTQFKSFVDSVAFEADLHTSSVSFTDIAYFAPQLYGMDQVVQIEGVFSKFVKDLKAENFVIKTGEKTEIRGTINLPDFRDIKHAFYQERIDYAYIDLKEIERIKLPKSSSSPTINLGSNVRSLGFIEASDVRLDGIYSQFVISTDEIKTAIGSVNLDNGILFTHNSATNSFRFDHSEGGEYDVRVNQFHLGKFLDNSMVGVIDGTFSLSGEAFSTSDIHFNEISGNVNRFDLADYSYSNIEVKNTSFIDKVLYAEVDVTDRNLDLSYSGTIDLNGEPMMNMNIGVKKALLGKLNLTENDSTNLVANVFLQTRGLNPNTMEGIAILSDVMYQEGDKTIKLPEAVLTVDRDPVIDKFQLKSSLVNASVQGKIDFNSIGPVVHEQIAKLLPGISKLQPTIDRRKKKAILNSSDCMIFDVQVIDLSSVLPIFVPKLSVSPGARIYGDYDAAKRYFMMDLVADQIVYDKVIARGINLKQNADIAQIHADYNIKSLSLNDSITLDQIRFRSDGNGNDLISILTWNPNSINESNIQWRTKFESDTKINFMFDPSFFAINGQAWNIEKEANIIVDASVVDIHDLKLTSGDQFILANGRVSKDDTDKLNFQLNEVDLAKISQMIGLDMKLEGKVNGWGYISNPYENLTYMGDLNVKALGINDEIVGDVYMLSQWDDRAQMVSLNGDLIYRGVPTFQFKGNYDISKEKDNLDFDLVFDQTNIAFANAFMDPLVVDDIKGFINGSLDVRGSISRPIIEGKVNLDQASAKIAMLGTSFNFNGPIIADADGFYINNMPIADVEGNTGALTGSIYHSDYKNWNFDVAINILEDYYKRDAKEYWKKVPLDRFLVMNTDGKNGDLYYGKAYATGTVGIFGYLNNLEINVNVKTQRGTWVNLALFGQTELKEDKIIEFINVDSTNIKVERKINYSGVTLNLDFDVTQDALIKLIINEQTGDKITAIGDGKISLGLDNIGQMSLEGTYTVREGSKYNFVLGPIKETFFISDGGSITWTGNPFAATLNLQAYYKVRANLGELSPELLTTGNQEINCYLNLTESLMKPTIGFDIKAPKAPEQDKTLLSSLTSDPDELNRQFFSLLLWKKFQPMKGSTRASGGAALDLASNQINSLLNQVSQDYKLNVDMNADASGRSEYQLGVEKGFLDGDLVISGSFGARNATSGNQTQSSLIGDIEIEYKLNKDGTFRINVFNESNDNRGLQTSNRGQFKQGFGVYYKENFNTLNDFKLLQQFLDIFRSKKNKRYPIRRKKEQTPVPKDDAVEPKKVAIIPEE